MIQPRLDDPRFKANPYPVYAPLRAETPVFRTRLSFCLPGMWVITRYEDVVSVLKDARFSKDYVQKFPWLPPSLRPMYRNLLTIDAPDHTRRSWVNLKLTHDLGDGQGLPKLSLPASAVPRPASRPRPKVGKPSPVTTVRARDERK